jgi:hypothetical protein
LTEVNSKKTTFTQQRNERGAGTLKPFHIIRSFLALQQTSLARVHHESYVVSFKQNPTKWFSGFLLDAHFLCLIQHQIHVLIKTSNSSLNPQIFLLKKPNLNPSFTLEKSENQINGLSHNPLNFGARHNCLKLQVFFGAGKLSEEDRFSKTLKLAISNSIFLSSSRDRTNISHFSTSQIYVLLFPSSKICYFHFSPHKNII